jgi:iron complex outermembrane receptor protein
MAYLAASERELAADRRVNPLPPTARDAFGQQVAALSYTRLLGSAGSIATTVYRISAGGDYDVEIDPDLWNFALDFRWNGVTSTWTLERPGLRLDAGVNANDYARDHHAYVRPALDAPVYFNTGHKRDASAFAKASWTAGALTLFGDVQGRWAEFRYVPSARSGIDGQRIDWRFLNPRLGASWQAARPVRLYASYGVTRREPTRSDMLAGFDDLDTSSVAFVGRFDRVRPERVGDLEAGVVVERRGARLAANVFDMRFRDEIAPIGALSYLGSPLRKNVSRSARRGVELDASWQPSSRVELGLLGTVMRGHIDEYTDDASGATFTDVEPLLTPRVSLTHRTSVAATHTLRLSLDGRYTGRSFLANTGDARFVLPASYLLDAGAELALGRHALVVHANNLLDSHRFASGYTDGAESYYYPLPPRNLLVTVRVGF